jgi:D-alanyl-lipoteichoic acid acyltransferase DltB (MBOAT superfamily)
MNFAELRFWGLLLGGLAVVLSLRMAVAFAVRRALPAFDKLGLLSLGWFLLASMSWVTFIIFLIVAVTTYVGLGWIVRYHTQHSFKYLLVLIPLQLAPLIYYKYADFIANRVLALGFDTLRDLVIPVGISFYTFQKVAFVVDSLVLKHPLPRFLDYMNFAGFFPQIVAGPIERRADLLPQMENFRFRWQPEMMDEGAGWIVLGLFFKCCLADNFAAYFNRAEAGNVFHVWLANLLFGLRIYYDFAGYSLIAVGLGLCLGVRLTLNFASPYCSTSIAEFWRRWHITLSQWFRDYLYIPMGGGRVRYWAFNVALVFVVSGIWHGAGWNFVLWGALHAVFLIVVRLTSRVSLPSPVAWSVTMLAAFFAWLCFYEVNTTLLMAKLKLIATPVAYSTHAFGSFVSSFTPRHRFELMLFGLLGAITLALEWLSVRLRSDPYFYFRRRPVQVLLVTLIILLAPSKNNGFIYFAF